MNDQDGAPVAELVPELAVMSRAPVEPLPPPLEAAAAAAAAATSDAAPPPADPPAGVVIKKVRVPLSSAQAQMWNELQAQAAQINANLNVFAATIFRGAGILGAQNIQLAPDGKSLEGMAQVPVKRSFFDRLRGKGA